MNPVASKAQATAGRNRPARADRLIDDTLEGFTTLPVHVCLHVYTYVYMGQYDVHDAYVMSSSSDCSRGSVANPDVWWKRGA